jgi:GNAT superfamily N-acetyltransferase
MSETPDQSIETLRQLPIQVTWTNEGYDGNPFRGGRKVYGEFFSIDLSGQSWEDLDQYEEFYDVPATFGGGIDYDDEGNKYLSAGTLDVGESFRRNGLGERLSRAVACIAVEQGCRRIKVGFSHPAALKIFRNIFGDDRIHYLHKDEYGGKIPISTPEEALSTIKKERQNVIKYGVQDGIWKHHPNTDEEVLPGAVEGVDAWIDIEGFDTSTFEKPIQTGILPGTEPEFDLDS